MRPEIEAVLSGAERWCVIQGDCRELLAELPDGSVGHAITDPPFDEKTHAGARCDAGKPEGVSFAPIDPANVAPTLLRVAKRWVVAFCAIEQIGAYRDASGDAWIRSGIWQKVSPSPQLTGDRPAQGAEGIAIMHRKGRKKWNGGGKAALWVHAAPRGDSRPDHPTPKPLPLMVELVSLFTDRDNVILDPFCGSGTTGEACLRLGRRFIGIELEPRWADLSRERLAAADDGLTLRDYRNGQTSLFVGVT